MNKKMNRIVSGVVAASMAMSGAAIPAFAAEPAPKTDVPGASNVGPANTTNNAQAKKEHKPNAKMGVWVDRDKEGQMNAGGKNFGKIVTPLGKNSFYRIKNYKDSADTTNKGNGYCQHIVEYAAGDDGTKSDAGDGWHAIPAAYMNENFTQPSAFGAYVVEKGEGGEPEVFFVKIDEVRDNPATGKTISGLNLPAADECFIYSHATADSATVSGAEDRAQTGSKADGLGEETNKLGTDFFIRIDDNFKDRGERFETANAAADEWVDYDITVAVSTQYNLDVTIPMYVCMYGYRASGDVVTPAKEDYQMKNYSSINYGDEAYIKEIVKNTIYTPIIDQNHTNAKINTIAYVEDKDAYVWFFSEPTQEELKAEFESLGSSNVNPDLGADYVYKFTPADESSAYITASGEFYAFYDHKAQAAGVSGKDNLWSFKAANTLRDIERGEKTFKGTRESVDKVDANHPLAENFVHNTLLSNGKAEATYAFEFNTTTPAIGNTASNPAKDEALAIRITGLQATPAAWTFVPFEKQDMRAGEIGMMIAPGKATKDTSAIDLSTCSDVVDITNRGWLVDAPAMQGSSGVVDKTKPGMLPLETMARMAGDNINPVGCTSVVHVEYTVTPVRKVDDVQVNTDKGVNRDDMTAKEAKPAMP